MIIIIFSILVLQAGFSQDAKIKVVTISTSYNNLLSNPEKTGMLDLILTEAFKRIDVKADIVYSAAANSLIDVNNGLGLNICRQFVKINKGQLNIESTQAQGTKVIITLPASL